MAFNNSLYGGQYLYSPQNQYTRYEPQPQMQMSQQSQPGYILKGRPVASIEEARASIIDFDGTTFYFPDVARKCVYAKRINLDGTSTLETYQLIETPSAPTIEGYVTSETFEKTIKEILNQINNLKGETKNVQQQSNEQFNF